MAAARSAPGAAHSHGQFQLIQFYLDPSAWVRMKSAGLRPCADQRQCAQALWESAHAGRRYHLIVCAAAQFDVGPRSVRCILSTASLLSC
jgi:hypothetical protein